MTSAFSPGLFIVIDGLDGSGKATQQKRLAKCLKSHGYKVKLIDFPRYKNNFIGAFIGECLAGKHGAWDKIDPYIASVIYAADRFEASSQIKNWLTQGYIVIADRYVSANQIYQGGKIIDYTKRRQFLKWLDKLEFEVFKIPRPDVIFFLDVPVEISMQLSKKSRKVYLKKTQKDLHEINPQIQIQAYQSAIKMVQSFNNWITIQCTDPHGNIFPIDTIAQKLWHQVKNLLDQKHIKPANKR